MNTKRVLALVLALMMTLTLFGCGEKPAPTPDPDPAPDPTPTVITNADEIADEMTTEDGKYEIGFVTDVGQLKDGSFNQGTFDGVKLYAANHNLSYKYYMPANGDKAPDEDRITAFAQILNSAGIVTTVRRRRGDDIAAACGQLAGEVKDRTRRAERLVIQKEEAADFFAATKKGSER